MTTFAKIKLKVFMIDLIFEILVNGVILTIAYLSNKLLETFFFYLSWIVFRYAVPKVYHVRGLTPLKNIIGCAICSCGCYFVAIRNVLPINISIFSSIILGIVINFGLYKIQDYIDMRYQTSMQTIDIYKMSEEELRNYAKSKGLSEMMIDTLVLKVIHNYRWVEIRNERNYTRTGIDYHKKIIEKKLNIKF